MALTDAERAVVLKYLHPVLITGDYATPTPPAGEPIQYLDVEQMVGCLLLSRIVSNSPVLPGLKGGLEYICRLKLESLNDLREMRAEAT